jgi:hypothetical protein
MDQVATVGIAGFAIGVVLSAVVIYLSIIRPRRTAVVRAIAIVGEIERDLKHANEKRLVLASENQSLHLDLSRKKTELARVPRYPSNLRGGFCGRCKYQAHECECFEPPGE